MSNVSWERIGRAAGLAGYLRGGPRVLITVLLSCLSVMVRAADIEPLQVKGSELQLHWQGQFSLQERTKLRRWLTHAATCAANIYGRLPRDPIRILLKRSSGGEPVPFGQVIRSELQGIQFWVNPEFSLEDFIADWTAVHEFVHLYIPHPGQADIWLSEGLATYYQNLLQARAGVISEKRAWQKLYEGFLRGREDNRYAQLSLLQLSPRMRETRSFMRVYWSGTFFFLQADVLLRRQSDNRKSLDSVIEDFVDCCLQRGQYSGEALIGEFDRLSGTQLFSRLYRRFQQLYSQPDPLPLLMELGVQVDDGRVILEQRQSPGVFIRRQLTFRKPT